MTKLQAGRALDVLIAGRVMGDVELAKPVLVGARGHERQLRWKSDGILTEEPPPYSTDITEAWRVVEAVQRSHPGWRFQLLGGDASYAYLNPRKPLDGTDPTRLVPFGWRAEFFGEIDPKESYGQRHGVGNADSPALAICRAALAAVGVPSSPPSGAPEA